MRCKKVLERLDDHVDGLLAVDESGSIREHLDECSDCRETAMAAKYASATLCAWNDVEPPADGYQQVLARLEALPLEAFERAVAPTAKAPTPKARLLRLASMDVQRIRRVATGGLAAAAAVLGVMVVTKSDEARPLRRIQPWANNVPAAAPAAWFTNPQFDPGLFYQQAGRPTLRPFGVEPMLDEQLVGSPR